MVVTPAVASVTSYLYFRYLPRPVLGSQPATGDFCVCEEGIACSVKTEIGSGMFERAGSKSSNVKTKQFWQHNNKPIALWSPAVIDQKVAYIHNNPVESGFVSEPWHWRNSSAIDYSGGKGILEIDFI